MNHKNLVAAYVTDNKFLLGTLAEGHVYVPVAYPRYTRIGREGRVHRWCIPGTDPLVGGASGQ